MITLSPNAFWHWLGQSLKFSGQKFSGWSSALLLGTATVFATAPAAVAAEQLFFTYGPLGRSISIEDLRTLVETGETTAQLRWYLRIANLDAETLRSVLAKEITLNLNTVDRITYSLPGEFALFEVGQVVHTRSRVANIQALRGALLVSLSEDNQVSLLEFLENYPTPGIYIDGVVLAQVARDVNRFIDRIEPVIATVEEFLAGLVCDCEADQSLPPDTTPPGAADSDAPESMVPDAISLPSATTIEAPLTVPTNSDNATDANIEPTTPAP